MDTMDNDPYLSPLANELEKKTTTSTKIIEKCDAILKELSNPIINMDKIKKACFTGIPDDLNGLRSLLWKLLLGYLPPEREKWDSMLKQNRKNYDDFVFDYVKSKALKINPQKKNGSEKKDSSTGKEESKLNNSTTSTTTTSKKAVITLDASSMEDHPLSTSKNSEWNTFFKDRELWDEIDKDTRRTRREISLFSQSTNNELLYTLSKQAKKDEVERHHDVLTRILFIYAKLNPGVRYVQGMNELLAPIYYCFYNDENPLFKGFAEADSFYCFTTIMSEAKENFVKSLDNTDTGIKARIANLNNMLRKVDQILWEHLRMQNVNPQFYSLRWLMLMLTQEFLLVDVLRLWDSFLCVPDRHEFMNYCCLALLLCSKENIMGQDFPVIMQVLQKNTSIDMEVLLRKTVSLYKTYGNAAHLSQFTLSI